MRPRTGALDALVDTVTSEHDVVEYLLFKLVTLKLIFVADERRFVDKAVAEVEKVVERLRHAEEIRDRALRTVATEWGVPVEELTLRRLAADVPTDLTGRITALQGSLQRLADEIEAVLEDNRKLASTGLHNLRTLLDSVAQSTGADLYTDTGRRHRTLVRPVQLDRVV